MIVPVYFENLKMLVHTESIDMQLASVCIKINYKVLIPKLGLCFKLTIDNIDGESESFCVYDKSIDSLIFALRVCVIKMFVVGGPVFHLVFALFVCFSFDFFFFFVNWGSL